MDRKVGEWRIIGNFVVISVMEIEGFLVEGDLMVDFR